MIPRVPALDIVAEPALAAGLGLDEARARAAGLLSRLNLPERLWSLPPATFSGGEQQRVNIARGFAGNHRVLILDEPTASLDAANREAFVSLMLDRKAQGCAFVGSSMTRMCAPASPTGSSTSRPSQRRRPHERRPAP